MGRLTLVAAATHPPASRARRTRVVTSEDAAQSRRLLHCHTGLPIRTYVLLSTTGVVTFPGDAAGVPHGLNLERRRHRRALGEGRVSAIAV